jgi:hypothetical protein
MLSFHIHTSSSNFLQLILGGYIDSQNGPIRGSCDSELITTSCGIHRSQLTQDLYGPMSFVRLLTGWHPSVRGEIELPANVVFSLVLSGQFSPDLHPCSFSRSINL